MSTLSVCAESLFLDLPFEERVREINRRGFPAEFWRWSAHDIDKLADDPATRINIFSGCSLGSMVHPDGVASFLDGVQQAVQLAQKLNCRKLILITGAVGPKGEIIHPISAHPATRWITAYKTLCQVADIAEKFKVVYMLENLNTKVDHAGYPLPHVEDAVRLLEEVGSPRVRLLLDLYHAQVEEGNIIQLIRDYGKFIGHVHVADVPGRHEPGTGEINYPKVVQALREIKYEGDIGLEAWAESSDDLAVSRFQSIFGDQMERSASAPGVSA
jgi:hydroxypyruvate isomerase